MSRFREAVSRYGLRATLLVFAVATGAALSGGLADHRAHAHCLANTELAELEIASLTVDGVPVDDLSEYDELTFNLYSIDTAIFFWYSEENSGMERYDRLP